MKRWPILIIALAAIAGCGSDEESLPEMPRIQEDRNMLFVGSAADTLSLFIDTEITQTLTVKNGGRRTLIISDISITGTDAAYFELQPASRTSIEALKVADIPVVFKPTEARQYKASLIIKSNSEINPTLEIKMEPIGVWKYTSQGKVVDSKNVALSGASVVCDPPPVSIKPERWKGWGTVTTGSDGTFKVNHSWECASVTASYQSRIVQEKFLVNNAMTIVIP